MSYQQSIEAYLQERIIDIRVKNKSISYPEKIVFFNAFIAILVMLVFIYYIFSESLPVFQREGLEFITGTVWNYQTYQFGALYLIVGTVSVTIVTLIIACPISILTAIFLAEFAPSRLSGIMRPMIELLVGIPSVVYGIFALSFLSKFMLYNVKPFIGSTLGFIPIFANVKPYEYVSILFAAVILVIMILPTIVVLSIEAMRSVPLEYKDASISLGATKWETIKKVVIPVALPGILTAVLLGMMRAMGETMAIVMLTGNTFKMPSSILDTTYTMTSKILNDVTFWYADDKARSALMGIALLLFVIEFILLLLTKAVGAMLK